LNVRELRPTAEVVARSTFAETRRELHAAKLVHSIKEQEIAMVETAQKYLRSLRDTADYQRLRRLLSAAVLTMAEPSLRNRQFAKTSQGHFIEGTRT
jgi:hypothetical protein